MKRLRLSPKVTQRDVAKAAQVSQALVSLVLGGTTSADVSTEHRQRVLEAAERLGYERRVKPAVDERRRTLAYIYPLVTRGHHQEEWLYRSYEDFYARKRMLLEEAAQTAGFVLISRAATQGDETLTQWLSEWEVEGVFWHCNHAAMGRWVQQRLPIVQFDRTVLEDTDVVMTNTYRTVELAMQHLMANGHRRIGFITKQPLNDRHSRMRRHAYSDFVDEAGLPNLDLSAELAGSGWVDRAVALCFGHAAERPTALVLPDLHALLLQKRLLKEGLTLPDDLSMVGIDNISACDFSSPALTSVDGSSETAAREAVTLMNARLRDPERPTLKVEVTPRLMVRESVATLSKAHQTTTVSP